MHNPPTVREEVNRKTLDALQTLLKRRIAGEIEHDQMAVAVDALWEATSGLLNKDLLEIFSRFK